MAVVVSDTSPIRALHHLALAHLLAGFFDEVLIPPAVAAELGSASAGVVAIEPGDVPGVRVQAPSDREMLGRLLARLDAGEAEALCLAVEVQAEAVLIDEAAGRRRALELGLAPLGVLGLLLRAKAAGHVARMAPLIAELERGIDFRISAELRERILRQAGESES